MQTANVLVALAGDRGTTVPRYGVTVAEIAVLQAIHGLDAVFDIEPVDDVEVNASEERKRLYAEYPATDEDKNLIVAQVFPSRAPLPQTLAELELAEDLFKATARVSAEPLARTRKKAQPLDTVPDEDVLN